MGNDWTTLTGVLIVLIVERLLADDVTEYIRFRAVCSAWRQQTEDPCVNEGLHPRYLPLSWMMLEETSEAPLRHRFLNTRTGEVKAVKFPEEIDRDNDVMGPTLDGLLTLREKDTHYLSLFNPFTGYVTELPSLVTMIHTMAHDPTLVEPQYHQPTAIGLSDDSAWWDRPVVAIFCKMVNKIAVARPGGKEWRWASFKTLNLQSAASLMGRFYACSQDMLFHLRSDGGWSDPKLEPVVNVNLPILLQPGGIPPNRYTLAAHAGDDARDNKKLTLVREVYYWPNGHPPPPDGFDTLTMPRFCIVYAVDVSTRVVNLSHLDGHALFIGDDRVVWVRPGAFSSRLLREGTVYTCRSHRLFTVGDLRVEPHGPLIVELHGHHVADGSRFECEFLSDNSEEVNPMGIVETLATYVGSDRGGLARPPLYMPADGW
uniref:KIB1-4 beta-propeller domain-containing protein n=1 Tax=Leersia perrieri TaxID=77586 RepID=A0A0D9WZQ1_9ORYZ